MQKGDREDQEGELGSFEMGENKGCEKLFYMWDMIGAGVGLEAVLTARM